MPAVQFVDLTFCRCGFASSTPVSATLHWLGKFPGVLGVAGFGQRTGSLEVPAPNASPDDMPSADDGTRNPLPQVPRSAICLNGVNLKPTFGVKSEPKSL